MGMDIPWFLADPQPATLHYLAPSANFNNACPATRGRPPRKSLPCPSNPTRQSSIMAGEAR
jgi:hypothetical protein